MLLNRLSIIPGVLVLLATATGFLLSSNTSHAESANASVTVGSACTASGGGQYSGNVAPGNYGEISGSTFSVVCNDANGYAIYAIGYSGDSYNSATHTDLIGTSSTGNIITNTSGTSSYWAMKVNPTSGSAPTITNDFNDYHVIPDTYAKVAQYNATTATPSSTGASVTATYKVNVSTAQVAGTYNGKVKYTMVHPNTEEPLQPQPAKPGKIVYHPNSSTTQGQMGNQSASNNASVTLWASNFKRDGYGFAGWNTAFDYSGTNYGPNQTITAPADVQTNGLSLYAVWIKSAGTIQNWDGCSSLAQGSTTALTDERDGNTYAVAKLADGKCWMIENLRLADKDSSNNDIELSSTNTHSPSLPLTNTWWFSTDNDSDTKPTSNHLSATTNPTTTAWCSTSSSNCDDQSMLATNNTTLFTNNTASSYSASSNVYSYGNYYNWYSATAGNGTYSISSGNVSGDICPAGWHLPTGKNASGDFGVLDVAMGGTGAYQSTAEASNRWRTYPNNFVYSGYVDGSSVRYRGSNGYYWSSSAYDSWSAYGLYFNSSSVNPGTTNNGKYIGRMVRCVSGV